MVKIAVVVLVGLLLAGGIGIMYNNVENVEKIEEDVYQGPVPIGYDLDNFRKTGDTIMEVEN